MLCDSPLEHQPEFQRVNMVDLLNLQHISDSKGYIDVDWTNFAFDFVKLKWRNFLIVVSLKLFRNTLRKLCTSM